MYESEEYEGDIIGLLILLYIVNWIVWYRVLGLFWQSVLVANVVFLIGFIVGKYTIWLFKKYKI